MKIGFDAKRAVNNMTGLGNYSRLVIDLLSEENSDNDLLLYAPRRRDNPRLAPLLERSNVNLITPDTTTGRMFSSSWRVKGITKQLKRDDIELFHGLSNELPLNIADSGIPSVVTIHDVIFRHFPHCYKTIDRKIYDYKFGRAAHNATRVIAISQCTARDIVDCYGINDDKIDIVYQGCDPQFARPVTPEQIASVRRKYNLPESYIIGVGTVEERKNQLLTLKALTALDPDITAVIVGRHTPYANILKQYITKNELSNRVVFLEGVPFSDFPALYAGALFSSYPSRYEGFGIPVIESLSVGTPVIIATGSCLEEAAGKEAPAVAPDDVDAYIDAARHIISNPAYRESLVAAGQLHIKSFSRENFLAGLNNSYKKALQ